MSTRSQIIIKATEDYEQNVLIYRHSDGYPDGEHGVISTIKESLKYCWSGGRLETGDISASIIMGFHSLKGGVRQWGKEEAKWRQGGNISIEGSIDLSKGIGIKTIMQDSKIHGAIEYLYIIKADEEAGNWKIIVYNVSKGTAKSGYLGDSWTTFKRCVLKKVGL